MNKRAQYIALAFLVLSPVVALVPLARVAYDWVTMARVAPIAAFEPSERGYDWVEWTEQDGLIHAGYVFPEGPAFAAGLRSGDVFHELNGQQYFAAEDLQQAIQGVPPGASGVYTVMQGDELRQLEVTFSRDPTFLYPISAALWQFSLWGFAIGGFLHVLGLTIVAPLAWRSRRARFSLVLISVSSLWIIGNMLRLGLVEIAGPPLAPDGPYDVAFQVLTLIGLGGWVAFPALLLHKVLIDARLLGYVHPAAIAVPLYLPAAVLATAAVVATVAGRVGPLSLNALATTVLFYACTYIASAAALMFVVYLLRPERAEDMLGRWNRTGSVVTLVLSVLAALAVLGLVTVGPSVTDMAAGWLIVSAQLLSVAPVILVSHATLQHGKMDVVLGRGIVYLALLGFIFFAFVGGASVIRPFAEGTGASTNVISGLYVIVLLLLFGRLARRVDSYASGLFASDRRRARQELGRFFERMRQLVSPESLVRESAQALARAFGARSVAIFLREPGAGRAMVSGTHHPEPPYITDRFVTLVWPHLQEPSQIWARNSELGGGNVPPEIAHLLKSRGIALAVPITTDDGPSGLMLIGEKRRRRAVYNLEDVDLVRSFSNQLGLAVERLAFVEREKELVRESAEAHLVALRAQINPHFLFNALNTIAALIAEQPREAEATVERVAAIFRHTLQAGSRAFVPLEDELDLVSQYLFIEKARFGEKLQIDLEVDDELARFPVPAFCLQTLVENSVKHGLERRRDGGCVRIQCMRIGSTIDLSVVDSGVGIPRIFEGGTDDTAFYGVGLKNVAARLRMLYGPEGRLTLTSRPGAGTTATISIPMKTEAAEQTGAVPPVAVPQALRGANGPATN